MSTPDAVDGLSARYHCVIYRDRPMALLWCTMKNESNEGIRLDALHLLETAAAEGGELKLPCPAEDAVVFTDSGSCHFAGVSRLSGESYDYDEKWLNFCPAQSRERMLSLTKRLEPIAGDQASPSGVMVFAGGDSALLLGVMPMRRALTTVLCRGDEQGVEYLAVSSGLFGYELPPGAQYVSEELLVAACPDGLTALRTYAEIGAALRDIHVTLPPESVPSGWISWYGYRLEMTEENVLANARVMRDRFLPYGADVIQLDNGWQRDSCSTEWRETNDQFPHGLEWLAQEVEQLGLRTGFWGNPIMVSSQGTFCKEHPEHLLRDGNGKVVEAGEWTWGAREMMYLLDATHPAAVRAVADEIRWLRETTRCHYWKFDFVVFLMSLHRQLAFADRNLVPGIETYRHAANELRKVVGDDYIYFCSNFIYGEFGIGDTTMTAPDIGNPCFHKAHHADRRLYQTQHFRQNATTILARHFLHRRLVLLNPDTVNIGTGTLQEARLRLSLVAFSGGQFFLGDRLPDYTEERLDLAEKGAPIYGEAAIPLDLFDRPYPDHPRIWHLPISTEWDQWDVVCLVNIQESGSITIDLQDAFPDRGDALLFDFWDERPLGALGENPAFTLDATESKILCLRKPRPHPHLLATNLHVTQGGVEVTRQDWSASTRMLELAFARRPGAQGRFWVCLPPGFDAGFRLECEGGAAERMDSGETTVQVSLTFHKKVVTCTLRF